MGSTRKSKQTEQFTHNKRQNTNHTTYGNNIIKPNDPRSQQGSDARLAKLHPGLMESVLPSYLDDKDLGRLSTSSVTLYTQTNHVREKRAFLEYLQAIVFNSPLIISRILDAYPNFLFAKPKDYGITEIECQFTWQRYLPEDETAFSMAQKLRHADAVQAMLPHYYKKLNDAAMQGDNDTLTKLKNSWIMHMPTEKEQGALSYHYIKHYLKDPINAITADTTMQVKWVDFETGEEKKPLTGWYFDVTTPSKRGAKIINMNENTFIALKTLRKKLFTPNTMKNVLDVDQFVEALYLAEKWNDFINWDQRNVYALCLIGLGQSLSNHSLGKKFCEGLYPTLRLSHEKTTESFQLRDLRSFYREHRDTDEESFLNIPGLGSSFFCSTQGPWTPFLENTWGPSEFFQSWILVREHIQSKRQLISSLQDSVEEEWARISNLYDNVSNQVDEKKSCSML